MDKNIYAAIAMALYDYAGNNVHDTEPTVITIQPKLTQWDNRLEAMTAKTVKTQDERVQIYD